MTKVIKTLPIFESYKNINKMKNTDQIEGFTVIEDSKPLTVKILLNEDRFIMASILDLAELSENVYMYLNDVHFYYGELMELMDDFYNEAEYEIEKEKY